jgi:hypothetical protein
MITAVDTSVLIDVLADDKRHADASLAALRTCQDEGQLVICEIVLAEISRYFGTAEDLRHTLDQLDLRSESFGDLVCHTAGQVFQKYRKRGGGRERILADFLVGAHAQVKCSRLLTRDRGFYRDYFPELVIIDPSQT